MPRDNFENPNETSPATYLIDVHRVRTTQDRLIVPYALDEKERDFSLQDIPTLLFGGKVDKNSKLGKYYEKTLPRKVRKIELTPKEHPDVAHVHKLLQFFTISDIHITDKESPAQLIYLQQLKYRAKSDKGSYIAPYERLTSLYSPVMAYTTHVLDAAVQTINALHNMKKPNSQFNFGISLGDTCNSTQYNELRWYIDVLDGSMITPSSGADEGSHTVDYQKRFKAAGLAPDIPWYQVIGNHDHFWMGSFPVTKKLRDTMVGDEVLAIGDVLKGRCIPSDTAPQYYMGVIGGSDSCGGILHAGPATNDSATPTVASDQYRCSLSKSQWVKQFFTTTSEPEGHGFDLKPRIPGFACYSFVPKTKSKIPFKVIVLDNTQISKDGSPDIHGHGFLDHDRWTWLQGELAQGQRDQQLMIIAAHAPVGVEPQMGKVPSGLAHRTEMAWWDSGKNAVSLETLIKELHSYPNFIMWIAGHRHKNTVKAFVPPEETLPDRTYGKGFWQVETSSLRSFPQQFRTFEIYANADKTVSIVTTNVDPAVNEKKDAQGCHSPAYKARQCAIAAHQLYGFTDERYPDEYTVLNEYTAPPYETDPTLPPAYRGKEDVNQWKCAPDPTIEEMPGGSYNAELIVELSDDMARALASLYP